MIDDMIGHLIICRITVAVAARSSASGASIARWCCPAITVRSMSPSADRAFESSSRDLRNAKLHSQLVYSPVQLCKKTQIYQLINLPIYEDYIILYTDIRHTCLWLPYL